MSVKNLREKIEAEMANAYIARSHGNEGRARVCAHRAAGWSLGPLYRERVGAEPTDNALELLFWYQGREDLPKELREAAKRLTTHVEQDHSLPFNVDPLQDAENIIRGVLEGL
jgi:HEPN domain-containing protein